MTVSDINFLKIYPIDQFVSGIHTLLEKKELTSPTAMKILLSVTIDNRVFVFDAVVASTSSSDVSSKLQKTLLKINGVIPFTNNSSSPVSLNKQVSLVCDLLVKEESGKFGWGTVNLTAEYPNGMLGGSPRVKASSKTAEELSENYASEKQCLELPAVSLFDSSHEFVIPSEQFYEVVSV